MDIDRTWFGRRSMTPPSSQSGHPFRLSLKPEARLSHLIKLKKVNSGNRSLEWNTAKLTVIWMIFCLVGNVFQVYHISSQYFAYGINTNVQLAVDDILELPTLTLCFELSQVVNWTDLTREERVEILSAPEMFGMKGKNIVKGYNIGNETKEEIARLPSLIKKNADFFMTLIITSHLQALNLSRLFNVTLKFEDIVHTAMLLDPSRETFGERYLLLNQENQENEVLRLSTFLKNTLKCYTLEVRSDYRILSYYGVMRQDFLTGMTSLFVIKDEVVQNINLIHYILTPTGKTMRSGFYSYIPLSPQLGKSFPMTYSTYEANLLPKPYETQCVNYTALGLGNRGECYERCLKEESLATSGFLPLGVNIMPNETNNLHSLKELIFHSHTKKNHKNMDMLCDLRCHEKDCTSIAHIPLKLETAETPGMTYIANIGPQKPTVRAQCQPMQSLTQFLTDVISTFGFWLGVSAFGIFRFFRRTSKAVTGSYTRKSDTKESGDQKRSFLRTASVTSLESMKPSNPLSLQKSNVSRSSSRDFIAYDHQLVKDYLLVNNKDICKRAAAWTTSMSRVEE